MTLAVLRATFLAVVFLASAASADDDDIKVSQQKFPDSDVPFNVVEGTVNAPPEAIWAVVSKCADYSKTMPRIIKSKELSREGDEATTWKAKCEVTADLPFPLSDLTGITLATHKVEGGGKFSREWTLVSGDYDINHGAWKIQGIDDNKKSLVTYKIRVKPKISLPTSWMVSAQKSALKDVILRMRENVKKP